MTGSELVGGVRGDVTLRKSTNTRSLSITQLHSATLPLLPTSPPVRTTMSQPASSPAHSQWYFKKDDLLRTPSALQHNIPFENEKLDRAKGCTFILTVGMALKLSVSTPSHAHYTAACIHFSGSSL
ncbi:hypothetical protein BC936DRAFT_141958 [Jimgerdemannia flammicorona]|uniref:Uncharacterized protein n=1 Tax=Jimgerdemannia flammicorona TaxID=994334 RepID=A0A433DNI9_9FUNG|nr:hypothetical protein BC936DRAFT_141958 [Jimgerdemannia flammicorona]